MPVADVLLVKATISLNMITHNNASPTRPEDSTEIARRARGGARKPCAPKLQRPPRRVEKGETGPFKVRAAAIVTDTDGGFPLLCPNQDAITPGVRQGQDGTATECAAAPRPLAG